MLLSLYNIIIIKDVHIYHIKYMIVTFQDARAMVLLRYMNVFSYELQHYRLSQIDNPTTVENRQSHGLSTIDNPTTVENCADDPASDLHVILACRGNFWILAILQDLREHRFLGIVLVREWLVKLTLTRLWHHTKGQSRW